MHIPLRGICFDRYRTRGSGRAEKALTCGNVITIGCQGFARAECVRKFLAPPFWPKPANPL